MPRVITLNASATEIVCGLGCEGFLVGRSHECDYPPSVRDLPVCTRPRFPTDGSSLEIDVHVKRLLSAGEPLYEVDAEIVRILRPDVILTQSQCSVCAVSDADLDRALASGPRPVIVSLAPAGLDDLWPNIHQVAMALGMPQQAGVLMRSLRSRLARLGDAAQSERPGVVCLEWLDPLMAAGNWVPALVDIAGGLELRGEAGKHSPTMSWKDLQTDDPDILIAMPCGFDLARTRTEMARFAADPRFAKLRAVRGWRVYITDGNQYFNRPGPRLVDSAEILAEILHGDRFTFGYRGKAWERFPQ
jgi:iron complex transport system substrate-binding protein